MMEIEIIDQTQNQNKNYNRKIQLNMPFHAPERTLLSVLQENQVYLDAPCAGNGSCGKCRVRFLENTPEPTEKDKRLLTGTEIAANIRLACTAVIKEDCKIELIDGIQQIQTIDTNVKDDQDKTDDEKVKHAVDQIATQMQSDTGYGIAIDIGTTTLAMSLILLDAKSTERTVVTSVNHQRIYGADVLSRIQAANDGKGAALQESIRKDLNQMMDELLEQTNTSADAVKKIAIAGNTTMCHLLLGYSCEKLGVSPFIPEDISLQEKSFAEVFGNHRMCAEVTILPGISAFIGADIVAGIYAYDMQKAECSQMLLDIGTNGEMVIGNKNGFVVTSAAAGPVFEGAGLSCGVAGVPGAISHLHINMEKEKTFQCEYETIGNVPPIGICGSGVIDAVAELIKLGIVDENGAMRDEWFEDGFSIAEDQVYISQRDIREIQMGKSAIRSGIETLLEEYEKQTAKKPERIFLAGGFGCFMDVYNAVKIGLFPESFLTKQVIAAGNAALKGAERFLMDTDAKEQVQAIVSNAKEQNLALHAAFQERYLEYMFF